MEQAYVYKWTHKPTLKWYVGSRTARGCHPDDDYICSSKYVKPLIKSNPEEWTKEIIAVGSKIEMLDLEAIILQTFDAQGDPRSFNKNNARASAGGWNRGLAGSERLHISAKKAVVTRKLNGNDTSWNKGLYGEQSHRFGKKLDYKKPWTRTEKSEEMIKKLKETIKIRNTEKLVCSECQQAGEGPAMYRWHFANCRQKGGK